MLFILDENMSPKLAKILALAYHKDHEIKTMEDYNLCGTPDVEWIQVLAKHAAKPAILTIDAAMRKRALEIAALRQAQLTLFMLNKFGALRLPEQAWRIIRVLPQIEQHAENHPGRVMTVDADKRKINIKL